MTIIARLRLLLAILALALPPLGGVAPSAAAMPMMIMEDCGSHDCAAPAASSAASHHAAVACVLGCLQAQMPSPLLLSAQIVPLRSAVQRSPLAPPAQSPLSSHAPSPPERPPRA